MSTTTAPALLQLEEEQVARANAADATPVVFVHGLWLLPSSWDRWAQLFEESGYVAVQPGWPDDPETVDEARQNPEAFANKSLRMIADHHDVLIRKLSRKPAVVGHSFGGLMVEMLAGRGLSLVSVAISPAPFRGVLPLPFSTVRGGAPVLRYPANRHRAVPLTYDQFRYSFANIVDEDQAKWLWESYSVPGHGEPLFQASAANLNPWTEDKVDTKNPERGPMLIIGGDSDHTVPWSIAHASYEREKQNEGVTEELKMANRGHSLTIDDGWREVAETALAFIRRYS
jgi:pimeloyl-ACP methyl ester carboxylesterase